MRINWANIFGLMFLTFLIYLFVKVKPLFEGFIDEASFRYDPPLLKVLMLGLLCLTVVAVAKIISRRQR